MAIEFDTAYKMVPNYVRTSENNHVRSLFDRQVVDPQRTAGNAAKAYQQAGDDAYQHAGNAAQEGLNLARQGINAVNGINGEPINQSIDRMNKNYELATGIAKDMLPTAQKVMGVGNALNADAGVLQGYGDMMWGQGNTLWEQGQGILSQGQNLLNLDPSGGGLVGNYVNWLNTIDPNRYVSMAASDVQNSYTNAQWQLNRSLSRSGADASSLKAASAQQQMAQNMAAALAGAKTRARMQGLHDQGQALQAALGQAQSIIEKGAGVSKAGLEAEAQAGAMQAEAGKLHGAAGDMYAKGGDIQYKSGSLAVEAGKLMSAVGNLSMDKAKVLVQAYGNASDAANQLARVKMGMGEYYAKVAQGYGAASQSWKASSGLFGDGNRNPNAYFG